MRMIHFSRRCMKEILRDPVTLFFGIGFPVILLYLLSAIQSNIPVNLFEIDTLSPGIAVFSQSFITLFSATLIAKDRESAFLQRLYSTPLTVPDFIFGYTFPLLLLSAGQSIVCFAAAIPLGASISLYTFYTVVGMIPVSIFNIALGLLCGSIFNVKQVGALCGALLTNLSAWLSGIWFDLDLVGGIFKRIAHILPFVHAVEMEKAIFTGEFCKAAAHLVPVVIYCILFSLLAVFCFLRQMKRQ